MHVQIVELRALQAVLRDEQPYFAPKECPVRYVIAKCPNSGPSYLYGLARWDIAPATMDFRARHFRKEYEKLQAQGRIKK